MQTSGGERSERGQVLPRASGRLVQQEGPSREPALLPSALTPGAPAPSVAAGHGAEVERGENSFVLEGEASLLFYLLLRL